MIWEILWQWLWRWFHRPGNPRYVRIHKWSSQMPNVNLAWLKSSTGAPTEFHVVWSRNGTALPSVSVPVSADTYALDFNGSTGTTAAPGDVIGATVEAHDHVSGLSSSVVPSVPAAVTIPQVAPGDPINVTLELVA